MLSAVARADDVVVKNGDHLTGTAKSLTNGKLQFATDHSGVVDVSWGSITSLQTAGAFRVWLRNGDHREGKLAIGADGQLTVTDGDGKVATLAPDQVELVTPLGAVWSGFLELSGRATQGNTQTLGALVNGELLRTTEDDEAKLKGVFRFGQTEAGLAERNYYGLLRYKHTIVWNLYALGTGELTSDTFKDINLTSTLAAGVGYVILKGGWIDLSADVGAAWVRSDFVSAVDDNHAAVRVGLDTRITLPFGLELTDSAVFTPNVQELTDWRLRNEAALSTGVLLGWKARVGMILEINHKPPEGKRIDDETYFVGLAYKF